MAEVVLCDTRVIIEYINGNSPLLDNLQQAGHILMLNSIIEMELLQGAHDKAELHAIEKKLNIFRRLDMQQELFDSATQLLREYGLSHGLLLPMPSSPRPSCFTTFRC